MKKNNRAMFYSLIMALIMLALGIVSFWGRNQGIFGGIYATAPVSYTHLTLPTKALV